MTDNEILKSEDEIEINLGELFQLLKKNIKLIIISILLCTVLLGIVTVFVINKKYESTTRLFLKPDVTEGIADYSQINSNNLMVNNYVEMIKGNNIQGIAANELNMDAEEINSCLSVTNETDTQIISITAKTIDPALSKDIVDAVVETFTKEAKEKLNVNNITVVDEAEIATEPVSPSLKLNLVIGALLGASLSIGYLFIKFMLDTHIHNKEEVEKFLGIPCLGSVPYFEE
ncbi:Wzz/FepE/Etk N-terminal domain-containing protein [Massilimicrobiota timonensis]|uniref:Wzz/FepE/Etk N-terminal domain-containing protein n=1 Tax=Massilimicrobiota timonensis TaxID=1776392 RepID=A0ABT7UKP2_9FIRM|nr:Wzz/FepE/Etk N-terminal domain-containing protein [Massilimicrobiota timonensis]MDM8196709.1 Wzz/FepE/Etk N-terminal domain-containing protein [Massilimicrobiota timonensis]